MPWGRESADFSGIDGRCSWGFVRVWKKAALEVWSSVHIFNPFHIRAGGLLYRFSEAIVAPFQPLESSDFFNVQFQGLDVAVHIGRPDQAPGPGAESFISNVEGVLYRLRSGVETAIMFSHTNEQKAEGQRILQQIDDALNGEENFTLIIEDPVGISGILPDDLPKVKQEELSLDEASQLRGAPVWLDNIREEYQERKG